MEWRAKNADVCEVVVRSGRVAVSGEIDVANAAVVGRRLRAHLNPGTVVIDCGAVTFVDVAGVRMLAGLGVAALAAGSVVCLRCSPALLETLALCGVRDLPGLTLDRDGSDDRS